MKGFINYINNTYKKQLGGSSSNKLCNYDFYDFIKKTLSDNNNNRATNFKIIYEFLLDIYNQEEDNFNNKLFCIILITFILEYEYYLIIFKNNYIEYGYNITENYQGKDPCLATYEEYIEDQKIKVRFNYDYNGYKIESLYDRIKSDKSIHYRSIIKHLSSNIDLLLDYFCEKIDYFFQKFIELLVNKLKKRYDNIELIMFQDKEINIDNINPNWLNEIQDKKYIDEIIKETIETYHDNKNQYIGEGNCFFSWLFIFYKKHQNDQESKNRSYLDYYGSCITSSLLEQFLLIKINIPVENINLILQNEIDYKDTESFLHDYHQLTQERLKKSIENRGKNKNENKIFVGYGISHWSSMLKKVDDNAIIKKKYITFRFGKDYNEDIFITYPLINIKKSPKEYFIAFVYECFDYYTELMNKNKDIIGNNYVEQIINFFNDERIKLFDDNIRI